MRTAIPQNGSALCRHPNHNQEEHKGKRDLLSLLKTFRIRDATTAHDKVYALLGLTSDDCEKLGINVQYGRSIAETYTEAAVAILRSTGDLEMLNVLKPAAKRTPELPSWVADWSDTTLPLEPLADTHDLTSENVSYANHQCEATTSYGSSMKASTNGSLALRDHICDFIVEVGTAMPTSTPRQISWRRHSNPVGRTSCARSSSRRNVCSPECATGSRPMRHGGGWR